MQSSSLPNHAAAAGSLVLCFAKNNMDAISYRYENNRNILTMSKYIR